MAWAKWNTKQLSCCQGTTLAAQEEILKSHEETKRRRNDTCQHEASLPPLSTALWPSAWCHTAHNGPSLIQALPWPHPASALNHHGSSSTPPKHPSLAQRCSYCSATTAHQCVINAVLTCTRATNKQILQLSSSSKWQIFKHRMMELTYHGPSPRSPNYFSNCKYRCKKNTEANYSKKHGIVFIKCTHLNEFSISHFHRSMLDFKMQSFEKHYSEFNEQIFCKCCRFYIICTDYILITIPPHIC